MIGVNNLPSWGNLEFLQPANLAILSFINVPSTVPVSLAQGLTAWRTTAYNFWKAPRNVLTMITMGNSQWGSWDTQGRNEILIYSCLSQTEKAQNESSHKLRQAGTSFIQRQWVYKTKLKTCQEFFKSKIIFLKNNYLYVGILWI